MQKLRAAFQGVVDIGRRVDCPFKIESNVAAPPAYMVKLALVVIGNYRWFGPDHDPSWFIYLNYKGANFTVRSEGQATWAIDADRESSDAKAAAQDLRKKIIAVAANLDKVLAQDLNQIVIKGEFTLNNAYPKIRHAYEWFREKARQTETTMFAWERMEQNGNQSALEALPERSLYGYTMMGYYFSLLESLCNVFLCVWRAEHGFYDISYALLAGTVASGIANSPTAGITAYFQHVGADKGQFPC